MDLIELKKILKKQPGANNITRIDIMMRPYFLYKVEYSVKEFVKLNNKVLKRFVLNYSINTKVI